MTFRTDLTTQDLFITPCLNVHVLRRLLYARSARHRLEAKSSLTLHQSRQLRTSQSRWKLVTPHEMPHQIQLHRYYAGISMEFGGYCLQATRPILERSHRTLRPRRRVRHRPEHGQPYVASSADTTFRQSFASRKSRFHARRQRHRLLLNEQQIQMMRRSSFHMGRQHPKETHATQKIRHGIHQQPKQRTKLTSRSRGTESTRAALEGRSMEYAR